MMSSNEGVAILESVAAAAPTVARGDGPGAAAVVAGAPGAAAAGKLAHRTWIRRWVSALALVVASVLAVNVLLDPYQVFKLLPLRDSYTPNEIYNKVEHLLARPQQHDAFFVGSSRMGMFEPSAAHARRPGRSYYNLSVLGSEPREQLAMLQALHAGGVAIREVVIGIDLYPFLTRRPDSDPAHRPHPAMSAETKAQFLARYLFLPSYRDALSRVVHTLRPTPHIGFDFAGTGRYHLYGYEAERARDPAAYAAKHLPAAAATPRPAGPPPWIERAFDELAQLRDWCASACGTVYWFIHPLHPAVLVNVPEETVSEFRRRITQVLGAVPDYSEDPRFLASAEYYDAKHYLPQVAERLLQDLYRRAPGTASPATPSANPGAQPGASL